MHGLALLHTLLSPLRTSSKLHHFRSAFLQELARTIFLLYVCYIEPTVVVLGLVIRYTTAGATTASAQTLEARVVNVCV